LVRDAGRTMLVLEDADGEPLDRLLGAPMQVGRFLQLAIGLAVAVGKLHERGLVHKDIKPANILVNSTTDEVRLTGFGIASRLPRERQSLHPPETVAGTLAYMAPEQTGRMNRSIDSRSDLYALGVTFYQILTGASRGHQYWYRSGRARARRRLYAPIGLSPQRDQRDALRQTEFRFSPRHRAGRGGDPRSIRLGGQSIGSGQNGSRVHRVR